MDTLPVVKIQSLINKVESLINSELIPEKKANNYKGGMGYVLSELKLLVQEEEAPNKPLTFADGKDRESVRFIATAMFAEDCRSLSIEYSGAGDELDSIYISYTGVKLDGTVEARVVSAAHDLISSLHNGFWNGDGGRGTIDFTLGDNAICVSWGHWDFYTEEEGETRETSVPFGELEVCFA